MSILATPVLWRREIVGWPHCDPKGGGGRPRDLGHVGVGQPLEPHPLDEQASSVGGQSCSTARHESLRLVVFVKHHHSGGFRLGQSVTNVWRILGAAPSFEDLSVDLIHVQTAHSFHHFDECVFGKGARLIEQDHVLADDHERRD